MPRDSTGTVVDNRHYKGIIAGTQHQKMAIDKALPLDRVIRRATGMEHTTANSRVAWDSAGEGKVLQKAGWHFL